MRWGSSAVQTFFTFTTWIDWSASRHGLLTPGERASSSDWMGNEVSPKPVWTLRRRAKSWACRQSIPDHPAGVPSLNRLSYIEYYENEAVTIHFKSLCHHLARASMKNYGGSHWSRYESCAHAWTPLSIDPSSQPAGCCYSKYGPLFRWLNANNVAGDSQYFFQILVRSCGNSVCARMGFGLQTGVRFSDGSWASSTQRCPHRPWGPPSLSSNGFKRLFPWS
jgi:hypothetical protein